MVTGGDGVFRLDLAGKWREIAGINIIPVFTNKLRGNAVNDVFIVGDFGVITHYNGLHFRTYPELAAASIYSSVAVKGNQIIAVGYTSTRAIIAHMWKIIRR